DQLRTGRMRGHRHRPGVRHSHWDPVRADRQRHLEVLHDGLHGGHEPFPLQVRLQAVQQEQWRTVVVADEVQDELGFVVAGPRTLVEGHRRAPGAVVHQRVHVEVQHPGAVELIGQVLGHETARAAGVHGPLQGMDQHGGADLLRPRSVVSPAVQLSRIIHRQFRTSHVATPAPGVTFPLSQDHLCPRPSPRRSGPRSGGEWIIDVRPFARAVTENSALPHSEPGSLPDLQDQDGVAVDRSGRRQQLQQEQERVSSIYRRLDDLREHTGRRLAEVRRADPGGTHQNRSERDAFATLYEDRLAQLNAVEDRLVFGRLDLRDGERQYIGRLGLSDTDHQPMLTDWRAPAARPFYQATAAHPGEVVLRRHLQTRSRHVVGLEDDLLDAEAVGHDVVLNGEGALLAALNAQRTGRMNDIVATIQAEQDAIIRSRLDGVLVVEGGPGTGKTAVALHRAAYLLYAHREAIARSGVLVVGPSPTFLRYIEQVLPALGETGVVSTTIGRLIPGIEAEGTESAEVAEIKGRPVWARIARKGV